ncbi:MAG: SEC-C domain-containing protein, partial [Ottowia sp.]|nr:SEC-C domain-containing protein [Ottowia sp.]
LRDNEDLSAEAVAEKVCAAANDHAKAREESIGAENMRQAERAIMLSVLDSQWKDHLARMDYLRQGIHLRGYAQKQPKQEFKREAFALFEEMLDKIKAETVTILSRVRIRTEEDIAAAERRTQTPMEFQHAEASGFGSPPPEEGDQAAPMPMPTTIARDAPKVGRNDPCPCGSGKKYK